MYSASKYPGPERLQDYAPALTEVPNGLKAVARVEADFIQEKPQKDLPSWRFDVSRETVAPKPFQSSRPIPVDEDAAVGIFFFLLSSFVFLKPLHFIAGGTRLAPPLPPLGL